MRTGGECRKLCLLVSSKDVEKGNKRSVKGKRG
jgi:hypothetical protein